MIIDFAIDAERSEKIAARSDPSGGAAALPADPDDHVSPRWAPRSRLMLGWGDGAELRRPLVLAIFGA